MTSRVQSRDYKKCLQKVGSMVRSRDYTRCLPKADSTFQSRSYTKRLNREGKDSSKLIRSTVSLTWKLEFSCKSSDEEDQTFIYGLDDSEQTFYNDNGDDQSYEQHPDDTAGDAGHDDGMRTHFEEDAGRDDGMRTHFEDLDIEDPGDNQGANQHPDDTGGGTGHDDGLGTFFDDGSMAPPPPPPPGPPEMGGDHAFHASEAEHTSSSWLHLR